MNSLDSFTHSQESDDVVVPYVQDSDKSVEELSKTFQGLSSPSKEDQSVDLPGELVLTAPFEIVL